MTDLAQALAQVGELAHVHGVGRSHARQTKNGLTGGGRPFRAAKIPFPAVVPFTRFQGIIIEPDVDEFPAIDGSATLQSESVRGSDNALFRPGQITFCLYLDRFLAARVHIQVVRTGNGLCHQDTVGDVLPHIRAKIKIT